MCYVVIFVGGMFLGSVVVAALASWHRQSVEEENHE